MQTSIFHVGSAPLTATKDLSFQSLAALVRAVVDHQYSCEECAFPVLVVSAPHWSTNLLKTMCEQAMDSDQPGWTETVALFFQRHEALLNAGSGTEPTDVEQIREVRQEITRELQHFPAEENSAILATWRIQWWGEYLAALLTGLALRFQGLPATHLDFPLMMLTAERFPQPLEIWHDPTHAAMSGKPKPAKAASLKKNFSDDKIPSSVSNTLLPLLQAHQIPIISGSCIQDKDGRIVRLRRENAHLLATLLAEELHATILATSLDTTEMVQEAEYEEEKKNARLMINPDTEMSLPSARQGHTVGQTWQQSVAQVTKEIDDCLLRWPLRPGSSPVTILDWMAVWGVQKRTHQLLERCFQWTQALALEGLAVADEYIMSPPQEQ